MTDAERLLKNYGRMCGSSNRNWDKCPLNIGVDSCFHCQRWIAQNEEKAAEIINEWADNHPTKTRQEVFLEQFPDAELYIGIVEVSPCLVDVNIKDSDLCNQSAYCGECKKIYWSQEVIKYE